MTFLDAQGAFVNFNHPDCKNILKQTRFSKGEELIKDQVEQKKYCSNESLQAENSANKEASTVEGKNSRMKFLSLKKSMSKKHSSSTQNLHSKGMT